jgi:copper(I)-binding protein
MANAWAAEVQAVGGTPVAAPASVAAPGSWVKVEGAWIRPMVAGQTATGGYLTLTASQPLTLIGFKTPVARTTELHEMRMAGDVMQMRAIETLALPEGQAVEMRPGAGGQHLMLMGVKAPLQAGTSVKLTLKLRRADGKTVSQDVTVPVRKGP